MTMENDGTAAFSSITLPGPLLLLGAGRMGMAMLKGWLKAGLPPRYIMVREPAPSPELLEIAKEKGILLDPAEDAIGQTAVLVAAVKPQVMDDALSGLAPVLPQPAPMVLSIAAGRTIASFKRHLGADTPVVRAMPNTPAAIGRGISAFIASPEVSEEQKALARALLSALGEVVEVSDEAQMDAVTAVSGSGPAYVFLLTECMQQAAERLGLPTDIAARLARATVSGAGALMDRVSDDPAALRAAVTSPGGTTAAALSILMQADENLCTLMEKAIAAALRRSRELSGG